MRSRRHLRHARTAVNWRDRIDGLYGDFRPLDPVRSIKMKLIVIIGATVALFTLVTWIGDRFDFGVLRTFPVALVCSLVLTQILARGMTRPLREMTAAAGAMARGDYSQQVHTDSQDEVGQLAAAFNSMAQDLDTLDTQRREMVANVSHELRTPVAALRAQLENLADGVVDPDPKELEAALTQVERLSRLISYLLDLSRLEAGAADLDLADVAVGPFLRDVVTQARHAADETGRDLNWEVSTTPEGLHLRADEERLRQVISNLLQNASRHSPRGGTIWLTGRAEPSRSTVVIEVLDEGPGIPVADRQKVFERFERGNAPGQRGGQSTGGTGLGLAIARWAVTLHGGTIAVADPPHGSGAMIRVTLPGAGSVRDAARPSQGDA
ncbi:HAMP domain-containing sensor histidine kinase [Ruania halotolerans]|uniref:HAMP domain-containing sensor histidine kinase n=1 Tax=Ruania halotolerans TaxID=2897773 RepID=UPI001E5BAED9|nr:HAMP domain-containing sensor histidine kinase [Ruania halotolerans]UFU07633.1 HAMP domain-containing histidine kinase [Ruania halotolerans]